MTKATHIVDGIAYCGTLSVNLPFVGMQDATLGACISPPDTNPIYSRIAYHPGTGSFRNGVNIKSFDELFGHATPTDAQVPFPGRKASYITVMDWPVGVVVPIKCNVPVTAPTPQGPVQYISIPDYGGVTAMQVCLSQTAGDMSDHRPGYYVDQIGQTWPKIRPNPFGTQICTPSGVWYQNVLVPATAAHPAGTTIQLSLVNNGW